MPGGGDEMNPDLEKYMRLVMGDERYEAATDYIRLREEEIERAKDERDEKGVE